MDSFFETPLPRRILLKRSLSAGALLWFAGLAAGSQAAAMPASAPAVGLRTLSGTEFDIVRAIARRILDDGEGPDLASIAARVALRIDRELQFWEPFNRDQFKQLLHLFESGSLFLSLKWGPFTAMTPEAQDEYLQDWMKSSWDLKRQGFQTFKTLIAFFHYTLDETWPRIGYDGPWVDSAPMAQD